MDIFDKLDPKWWFGNVDDPEPPDNYRPNDAHRTFKWYIRNPFRNAFYYVIGVRDRERTVTGRHPSDTFAPHGGWNIVVTRCQVLYLPFVSYARGRFQFYLGWRVSGGFGIKCRLTETVEYAPRESRRDKRGIGWLRRWKIGEGWTEHRTPNTETKISRFRVKFRSPRNRRTLRRPRRLRRLDFLGGVVEAEVVLGGFVALLGGAAEPFDGFGVVLRRTPRPVW